jgi:hypothetical protein
MQQGSIDTEITRAFQDINFRSILQCSSILNKKGHLSAALLLGHFMHLSFGAMTINTIPFNSFNDLAAVMFGEFTNGP